MLSCRAVPWFVISVSATAVSAWLVARWLLPQGSRLGTALLALVAAPLLVVPTLELLGVARLLAPGWAAAALALQALLLAAVARKAPAPPAPAVAAQAVPGMEGSSSRPATTWIASGVLAALVAHLAAVQLVWGWMPVADDRAYHAPMAAHWIRAGRLLLAPYDYHAYFPANAELFSLLFVLPTRMDGFAGLAGFFWTITCALAVAYVCQRAAGDGLAAAIGASAVLACQPLLDHAESFAAVELAASASITAAAGFALAREGWRGPRARSCVCGALCGLAVGCKISYLPAAALILAASMWSTRTTVPKSVPGTREDDGFHPEGTRVGGDPTPPAVEPDGRVTRPVTEGARESWRARLSNVGCFALMAAAYSAPWYVRNWLLSGNPVFPAQLAFFEGPLDLQTQRITSLFYQLRLLQPHALVAALAKLSDWPHGLSLLCALGYVATPASWFLRAERRRLSRPAALAFLIGIAGLLLFGFGPFTGTTDAAQSLYLRPRFFVLFMVQGLLQWAVAVARISPGRRWWWAMTLAIIVLSSPLRVWMALGAAVGLGAALWLGAPHTLLPRVRRIWPVASGALLLALPLCIALLRQPATDTLIHSLTKDGAQWAWLDELPSGSRVAWFSNDKSQRYYASFGRRLQLDSVSVQPDGSPFVFLHQDWRTTQPTFLDLKPRPDSLDALVANLRRQAITHVALITGKDRNWQPQRDALSRTEHVSLLHHSKTFYLFRLDAP